MPRTCNIDSRGKRARLVYGIVLVILGVVLIPAWALHRDSVVRWVVSVGYLLAGAVAVSHARAGWGVRAGRGAGGVPAGRVGGASFSSTATMTRSGYQYFITDQ